MRRVILFAFLTLAGCQSTNWAQISQAVATTITTSLPVACQSAQTIVGQADQNGLLKNGKAAVAAAKIDTTCNKVQAGLAAGSAILNLVNTSAAVILGVAGANGINLPGVPGLK